MNTYEKRFYRHIKKSSEFEKCIRITNIKGFPDFIVMRKKDGILCAIEVKGMRKRTYPVESDFSPTQLKYLSYRFFFVAIVTTKDKGFIRIYKYYKRTYATYFRFVEQI